MTNYEKIKNMNMDEMAEFLYSITKVGVCTIGYYVNCCDCLLYPECGDFKAWLKKEVNYDN